MAEYIRKSMGPGRWAKVMDWQVEAAPNAQALGVLTFIVLHTNKGGTCRLRYQTIAERLGLSRAQTGRALRALKDANLITTEQTGRSPVIRLVSHIRDGSRLTYEPAKEHPSVHYGGAALQRPRAPRSQKNTLASPSSPTGPLEAPPPARSANEVISAESEPPAWVGPWRAAFRAGDYAEAERIRKNGTEAERCVND